jgi:biopolymer transport protein ExbB
MPEIAFLADIGELVEAGGIVLRGLLLVALVLWAMIIERALYFWRERPRLIRQTQAVWDARVDHASWRARQVKRRLVAETRLALRGSLPMIKAMVALCPLIGLLGTVTGMIQVFEVMAVQGTGNVRAMASGVSAATLPTMAGMVLALSALYPVSRFEHLVARETRALKDHMLTH